MYTVRFSTYRLAEIREPAQFQMQVGRWLEIREAENSYLLGRLPWIMASAKQGNPVRERFFILQDGDVAVAAAILFDGGCLCHTWASSEMLDAFTDGLVNSRCNITSFLGPAHVSWQLAKSFAERTGQRYNVGRAERIYQLARTTYQPPTENAGLQVAVGGDFERLLPWMRGFIGEAEYEIREGQEQAALSEMLRSRALYLWKQDGEVRSMAAWTAPTARGGSINFVYTPPENRRRGYAKAVVSALANMMLSSGKSYCFILTDTADSTTHHLYQAVGARTLCELLRCSIEPVTSMVPGRGQGAVIAHWGNGRSAINFG